MKFGSRTIVGSVIGTGVAWSLAVVLVSGQAAPAAPAAPARPAQAPAAATGGVPTAEQVFKNVQVLKGISVQEFMGAMGVFSAALGMSCEDCHAADDRNWDGFAAENPRKQMARMMMIMMTNINRQNFGGRQMITCYSCHRGDSRPKPTPTMDEIYGGFPPNNPPDIITQEKTAPAPATVLDKYIAAVGGAQRAAAIKSYTAKGSSVGYGPESQARPVEIYAVAPDKRVTIIHTDSGLATTTYNGTQAWYAAPYRPVDVLEYVGADRDGARIDAMLGFPAVIKELATNWRTGRPQFIDGKELTHVQGTTAAGVNVSLFFDPETGLLVRQLRFSNSPVGRIPTQWDYADYREVAGVKLPFKYTMSGINGKDEFELESIQPNVTIPMARFNRPAPPVNTAAGR